ncbi:MAG: pyridoxal-phosphate dependent enzyme [Minisyncoccia bacterium]
MNRTVEQVRIDPIFQSLCPKGKQFMRVRFLPPKLNPFAGYFINVAALIAFGEFPHIKTIPAWQMMFEDLSSGRYKNIQTLVVPSSGNTGHGVARLAPAYGLDVLVVLAADVASSKKEILASLSSVDVREVGKGKSVAEQAKEESQRPGHYLLDQYNHPDNMRAHQLYTGPEILRVLDNDVGVVAIAMGSGGTALGVGRCLKEKNPDTIVLGVCPAPLEAVPGARNRKRMQEVVTMLKEEEEWYGALDAVVEVSRKDSFTGMRKLWGAVEPQPGPTSGLAYRGLMWYLSTLGDKELKALRGKNAAFICPDDGRFYSERTTGELDTGQGL